MKIGSKVTSTIGGGEIGKVLATGAHWSKVEWENGRFERITQKEVTWIRDEFLRVID